jgi:predicted dehydrogenase
MADGFAFTMQYTVNFENATAVYDLAAKNPLTLQIPGQEVESIALEPGMGYQYEIPYFIDCVRRQQRPDRVSARDAAAAIRIIEAEVASVASGQTVVIPWGPNPNRDARRGGIEAGIRS